MMAQYWVKPEAAGAVYGPYDDVDLRRFLDERRVWPNSLVSTDAHDWRAPTTVAGLLGLPPIPSAGGDSEGSQAVFGSARQPSADAPPAVPIAPAASVQPPAAQLTPAGFGVGRVVAPIPEPNLWLVWPTAILLTIALGVFFALVLDAANSRYSRTGTTVLAVWTGAGLALGLLTVLGVGFRSALAYRSGMVAAPVGAGFLALLSLSVANDLPPAALAAGLSVILFAAVTPMLWSRPGAKRYFGLCCPTCHGLQIRAEDFAFAERRCGACGTRFRADGTPVHGPWMHPVYGQPVGAAGASADTVGAWPAVVSEPGQVGYARSQYQGTLGRPGATRRVGWMLAWSIVVLCLGLLNATVAIGGELVGSRSTRQSLESATVAVNCSAFVGYLALWIAWLVWIYRIHRDMRDYTAGMYPISPGKAIGFAFIPFFNLYWYVAMPYKLAKAVQGYLRGKPGTISPEAVLTYQILGIIPGACIGGLGLLFYALAARSIQNGLNALWVQARADLAGVSVAPG